MEYVHGWNLKDFYSRLTVEHGDFSIDLATDLVRQIASALEYVLRTHNIVHRDLKLENVMVDSNHTCKIIDFGLARKRDEAIKLPSSWEINAAPRYRSPEKWIDFHMSDDKSDIWSLGVIFYYLLTGQFPFSTSHSTSSEMHLRDKILDGDIPILSQHNPTIPFYYDSIVHLMLSRNQQTRPSFSELISILGSNSKSLSTVLRAVYERRAERLPPQRFNYKVAVQSFDSMDQLALLHQYSYRESIIEDLRDTRRSAIERLAQASVKWGPSLLSTQAKVANVCEVLLAIDEYTAGIFAGKDDLANVLKWLLNQEVEDGYPSLSFELVTTHCTALSVLALYHIGNVSVLPPDLRKIARDAAVRAYSKLLRLAGPRGWGTWAKTSLRIQPTLWALRAMVSLHSDLSNKLVELFGQVRAMHTAGYPGWYGFRPGSPARVSPTSCFLLIASRMDKLGYSPRDEMHYNLEKHNAIKFLISQARQVGFWPPETEGYYVDRQFVQKIGNVEQLTWLHISGPMALEALAEGATFMGLTDDSILWLKFTIGLNEKLKYGLFDQYVSDEVAISEPTFPTAYACMALRAAETWMDSFYQYSLVVPFPSPSIPSVYGNKLIKSAAAIVKDGKLLLVRKFGTDQLIMPGGGIESGEIPSEAMVREIREELRADVILLHKKPIGIYQAPAAFEENMEVEITLFHAQLSEEPHPSAEIEEIVWYDPVVTRAKLSPIVRDHIVPSLQKMGLLK